MVEAFVGAGDGWEGKETYNKMQLERKEGAREVEKKVIRGRVYSGV